MASLFSFNRLPYQPSDFHYIPSHLVNLIRLSHWIHIPDINWFLAVKVHYSGRETVCTLFLF